MKNFLLCTVFPPGASKVDLTHKFVDFSDFTQFFQMWPDSVLIDLNDVNNVIYINFKNHDQLLKVHRFLSRILYSWPKNVFFWIFSAKWLNFANTKRNTESVHTNCLLG